MTAVWAHRGSPRSATESELAEVEPGEPHPAEPHPAAKARPGETQPDQAGSEPGEPQAGPILENTVEAFLEARRLGADGVELDVRRSADGALVVHHDAEVPGVGLVCETAVRDLPAHVPLLAAALGACQGMVVNVEIKNAPQDPDYDPTQSIAIETARAIADVGWRDRVVVSSFSPEAIEAVRAADPGMAVGLLLEWWANGPAGLEQALAQGYDALHPFVSQVDQAMVARAQAAGLALHAWVVNAERDLQAMVGLGVDAVITDRVPEALAVARRPSHTP